MRQTLEDRRAVLKILFLEPERQAELLGKIRMVLLLIELVLKVVVEIRVVGVFHHAKSKALAERDIVQVVLQRESLEPLGRKFALSQLAEVATVHQLLHARPDHLPEQRINEAAIFHEILPGYRPSASGA